MLTAIIDYESGNLHSAHKAFERMANETGAGDVIVTSDADVVAQADDGRINYRRLILGEKHLPTTTDSGGALPPPGTPLWSLGFQRKAMCFKKVTCVS